MKPIATLLHEADDAVRWLTEEADNLKAENKAGTEGLRRHDAELIAELAACIKRLLDITDMLGTDRERLERKLEDALLDAKSARLAHDTDHAALRAIRPKH